MKWDWPRQTMTRAQIMASGLWRRYVRHEKPQQVYSPRGHVLTPEKQKELNDLCRQLFARQELITSGKLQLLGLAAIKKRMGKRWRGLCQVVYDTTEEVIREHLGKGDIFIRYHDDTYVMLFAYATLDEGLHKAQTIAEEVRRRLFAMDEPALRALEVTNAVRTMHASDFSSGGFLSAMDDIFADFSSADDDSAFTRPTYKRQDDQVRDVPPDAAAQVGTARYKPQNGTIMAVQAAMPDISCVYMPLWDVPRKATTAALSLAKNPSYGGDSVAAHVALCRAAQDMERVAIDLKLLDLVRTELVAMAADGRKCLLICPVQYETLHNYASYELYKNACEAISPIHRGFLSLLVLPPHERLPQKEAYWFARPIRAFVRFVFAAVPPVPEINLNYLRNAGVDAVGAILNDSMPEAQKLARLGNLAVKVRTLKFPHCFCIGVDTLSLATSLVCSGFGYLGGNAVIPPVDRPQTAKRYSYEDLVAPLIVRMRR